MEKRPRPQGWAPPPLGVVWRSAFAPLGRRPPMRLRRRPSGLAFVALGAFALCLSCNSSQTTPTGTGGVAPAGAGGRRAPGARQRRHVGRRGQCRNDGQRQRRIVRGRGGARGRRRRGGHRRGRHRRSRRRRPDGRHAERGLRQAGRPHERPREHRRQRQDARVHPLDPEQLRHEQALPADLRLASVDGVGAADRADGVLRALDPEQRPGDPRRARRPEPHDGFDAGSGGRTRAARTSPSPTR